MRYLILLGLCLFTSNTIAWTNKYDATIKKWSGIYTPSIDWRLNKAQFIQESGLRATVKSRVGATGISQIMPRTWEELERKLKIKGSALNPNLNIQFGIYYMAQMMKGWSPDNRTHADRIKLAQASYNAGRGNLYKAQKKAGGANDYKSIISSLHEITGKNHKETVHYVKKIWQYWKEELAQ